MKNKFLLAILCLGLLTLNFSCQKEEDISTEDVSVTSKITINLISKSEFQKRSNINSFVSGLPNRSDLAQSTLNFEARSSIVSESEYDFYVDDSQAYHVSSGDYESYTFAIVRPEENNLTENLVLSRQGDENYQATIVSYDLTESEIQSIEDGSIPIGIEDNISIEPIQSNSNTDPDFIAIGSTGIYYDTSTGGCFRPEFDHSGDTVSLTWVPSNCPQNYVDYISDSPGNEGTETSGGGTNTNDDTNDTDTTNTDDGSTYDGASDGDGGTSNGGSNTNGGTPTTGGNDGIGDPTDCILDLQGNCIDDMTVPLLPLGDEDDIERRRLESIIEAPLSSLETEESLNNRILAVGQYFELTSHSGFSELLDMLRDVVNSTNLSDEDRRLIVNKSKNIYSILKPRVLEMLFMDSLDELTVIISPENLRILEKDSATIAFLPFVKTLVGEHWPQNAEQWSALSSILFQPEFLLEIGLAFIPGSSIIDAVQGINEGDYLAVTLGIASVVVDAFGGVILKAIGKIGKVAWKSFKIFKVAFRYIDEIADIITLGYKADLVDGIVKLSDTVGTVIAEIENNVIRFLANGAKSIIKVADLKFLDNVIPSPSGNIGKLAIDEKALKIKPDNSDYANDIADIIQNGDLNGNKTEALMQDLLAQDGFNPPDFDVHLPSNQGFDNVLIKRGSNGSIEDVIINESKQVGAFGNISLSSGITGCNNCTQMSQDWVRYTIDRMTASGNNNLIQLANDIENFGVTNVTQMVSGVNKNTGELVIINITGYN